MIYRNNDAKAINALEQSRLREDDFYINDEFDIELEGERIKTYIKDYFNKENTEDF